MTYSYINNANDIEYCFYQLLSRIHELHRMIQHLKVRLRESLHQTLSWDTYPQRLALSKRSNRVGVSPLTWGRKQIQFSKRRVFIFLGTVLRGSVELPLAGVNFFPMRTNTCFFICLNLERARRRGRSLGHPVPTGHCKGLSCVAA
jgi:hypothetical protein